MRRRVIDREAAFQSVRGASEITGLSTKFLREGCRNGTLPHIRVGNDYRLNMRLLLERLDELSVTR